MSDELTAQQAAQMTAQTIATNAQKTSVRLGPLLQECFQRIRAAIASELYVAEFPLTGQLASPADRLALTRALQQQGFAAQIRTEEQDGVDVHVLLIGWQPTKTPRGHAGYGGTHLLEHHLGDPDARPTPDDVDVFHSRHGSPLTPPADDAPGEIPT